LIAGSPYAARGRELVETVTSLVTRSDVRGLLTLPG
jgi:hypothetical protein